MKYAKIACRRQCPENIDCPVQRLVWSTSGETIEDRRTSLLASSLVNRVGEIVVTRIPRQITLTHPQEVTLVIADIAEPDCQASVTFSERKLEINPDYSTPPD